MKKKTLELAFLLCCICGGVSAGYGISSFLLTSGAEMESKKEYKKEDIGSEADLITKESTLNPGKEESVLFAISVQEEKEIILSAPDEGIKVQEKVVMEEIFEEEKTSENLHETTVEPQTVGEEKILVKDKSNDLIGSETPALPLTLSAVLGRPRELDTEGNEEEPPETASKVTEQDTVQTAEQPEDTEIAEIAEQPEASPVITYPMEIFGQVPVENRSDAYVSYFEFALDMVHMLQPEIKKRGLSETGLFTEFALKALLCGVDVKNLKINEPISRKEAALALWLAADVLEHPVSNTKAADAKNYASDISSCSLSEKKAIVCLYKAGVVKKSGTGADQFRPAENLQTKDGETWILRMKQCWK